MILLNVSIELPGFVHVEHGHIWNRVISSMTKMLVLNAQTKEHRRKGKTLYLVFVCLIIPN